MNKQQITPHTSRDIVMQSIEISKLDDDIWDARRHEDREIDKARIELIAKNILHFGLLAPIIVKAKPNGRYSIIDGRYRTKACKELGWKNIRAEIRDVKNKADEISITVSANTHRVDYDVDEKLDADLSHFKLRGYDHKQILELTKKMVQYSENKSNIEPVPKDIPDSFLDALELCGLAPRTVYERLQTIVYLHPLVLKSAQREHLNLRKRQMLVNKTLRDHPKIAIQLVKDLKGLSDNHAKIRVRQTIRDLETGATIQHGNSYIFDSSKREKVDTKIDTVKTAAEWYYDIMEHLSDLMYNSTAYKIHSSESTYEPKHIENTEKHRIDILKGLEKNELIMLETNIGLLKDLTNSFLDLIDREIERRNKNKK